MTGKGCKKWNDHKTIKKFLRKKRGGIFRGPKYRIFKIKKLQIWLFGGEVCKENG